MANYFKTGEIQGSTTAAQLPDIPFGFQAWLMSRSDNAGSVYLGGSSVSKADGTTDTTTGLELTKSTLILLQGPGNLSSYYRICDNAGDDLTYMVDG